ncbi:alpha/beta fold hydrolase [Paraglaciecola sp. 2405UD69-4]|uniref:alpha/beta hydrolase family protein n=1 Tax=Paraglaciecola sp. 2405UD69-4 TaxID=3391836 RepID=UPI0039C9CA89
MSQSIQSITLQTKSGDKLQAYWFTPEDPLIDTVKGKIVIASAMGVEQNYYRPIATWLAEQGYSVLTFDCRGIGESKSHPLKHYQCDIIDWAQQDYSAALDFTLKQTEDTVEAKLPVYWVGHSLGGQIFPLVENIQDVTKIITISAGTGYWKHNVTNLRKKAFLFWHLIAPISTALYGYFPGKKLGIIGNLPKKVMSQWRKWCLHPEYCVGVESELVRRAFMQIKVPLHSIGFSDDEMLSVTNMRDLHCLFSHQDKRLSELTPVDIGAKHVGHLGFFKAQFEDSLWPDLLLPELIQPGS